MYRKYVLLLLCALILVIVTNVSCNQFENNNKQRTHYENGKRKMEVPIKVNSGDTLKHGVMKRFYKDGSLKAKVPWENDERDGEFIRYYKDGQKKVIGRYEDGKLTDTLKTFFSNGVQRDLKLFENGRLIDYKCFTKSKNRDTLKAVEILSVQPFLDTIMLGESYPFKLRIGNRMPKSKAVIILSNSYNKNEGKVYDTIAELRSEDIFEYAFTPDTAGQHKLYLKMMYLMPRTDSSDHYVSYVTPVEFYVKDNKGS